MTAKRNLSVCRQRCELKIHSLPSVRLTASARSSSDSGSLASIKRAAEKSVSIGFVSACTGLLVQALVQDAISLAITTDRFVFGTVGSHVRDVEVAGSNPVIPIS